jgi:hypothetical protein
MTEPKSLEELAAEFKTAREAAAALAAVTLQRDACAESRRCILEMYESGKARIAELESHLRIQFVHDLQAIVAEQRARIAELERERDAAEARLAAVTLACENWERDVNEGIERSSIVDIKQALATPAQPSECQPGMPWCKHD